MKGETPMSNNNNRRCGGYGALRSLSYGRTASGSRGLNDANARTCCGNCGGCPACSGCFAAADDPNRAACNGAALYFTGPCGARPNECACSGVCAQNQRPGGCPWCGSCNPCPGECAGAAVAAEFVALYDGNTVSAGALEFELENGNVNAFTVRRTGIRINVPGIYVVFYSFNATTTNTSAAVSLALNGEKMRASQNSAAAACGQAMFAAECGDMLALNLSENVEITGSEDGDCVASFIILRVG